MSKQSDMGAKGEHFARSFLEKNGYEILHCNWRYKHLEADIIAKQGGFLVIVEVKTRKTDYFGEPEESVDQRKQNNLLGIANAYLGLKNMDLEVRFDIISIILKDENPRIHHIKEAFTVMD